jgi:hypothetical protein
VIPGPDLSVCRVGESAAARAVGTAEWALRVLADPEACPPAVLHPLGFLCFPIKRGCGVGVCVHVWLPGRAEFAPALATSTIHSHSWDLLSLVLLGRMGNEVVDTAAVAEAEATHRVYEIRSVRGADEVVPTSRCVRSSRREIRYAGPGEVYRLAGGEFHTSVVEDAGCVATVLLADSRGGVDRSLGPVEPGRAVGLVPRRHAGPTLSKLAVQTVLDRSTHPLLAPPC